MGAVNCKDRGGNEFVEKVVCKNSDLKENEMKVFDLGQEKNVLVVKQDGKISAVGTKCSHYGAPLITGALGKGNVRCPWHGACFSLATGDIEDFPGLDSIPCYQVQVLPDGGVKIRAKKSDLEANKRMKEMCERDKRNATTFVVVGGGAAAANCVETLRQEGFTGRLVMLCKENYLPYDRVKVSKAIDSEPAKIQLRQEEFYKEHNIEVMKGVSAVKLDSKLKQLQLSNGEKLNYASVFIATGLSARKLDVPGSNLENVITLRNIDDTLNLRSKLKPEIKVVVVGSSFVAMESAASCVSRVKSVTVVGRSEAPLQANFGKAFGMKLASIFTEKGVILEMNKTITSVEGSNGKVSGVVLSDGRKLPADIVIMAVGSTYNTEFLAGSGVTVDPKGYIPVNKFLETNVKGVYAGGDIAYAPVAVENDKPAAIGHWQLSQYHGHIAALNMLGKSKPLHSVPFFWTMLFGKGYRYAGYCEKFDDVIITGDFQELKFTAYYCSGDSVKAVMGTDNIPAAFAEYISVGNRLAKKEIKADSKQWLSQVPKGKA